MFQFLWSQPSSSTVKHCLYKFFYFYLFIFLKFNVLSLASLNILHGDFTAWQFYVGKEQADKRKRHV